MYKVFFNDRKLIFADQSKGSLLDSNPEPVDYKEIKSLKKFIDEFIQNPKLEEVTIVHKNLEKLWKEFRENFKYIIAAGGLVFNSNNEFLAIYRLDKWDLPKGKAEKGEKPEVTAIREVEEECGITGHQIVSFLLNTYHIYKKDEKLILKQTYWYEMSYDKNEPLVPQTKENIHEVRWVKPENISMIIQNTYPSILEVLKSKHLV